MKEYKIRAAFALSLVSVLGHIPSAPMRFAHLFKGVPALELRRWKRSPRVGRMVDSMGRGVGGGSRGPVMVSRAGWPIGSEYFEIGG